MVPVNVVVEVNGSVFVKVIVDVKFVFYAKFKSCCGGGSY